MSDLIIRKPSPAAVSEETLIAATEGRKHFSTQIPGLQTAWDSTSLGEFKTCPRSYYYTHILGLRGGKESVHLTFGILYHAGLEAYDRFRSAGADHQEAVRNTLVFILQALRDENGKVWESDDTKKNARTLVRSVLWYLDEFEHDPLVTVQLQNGKPAVELSFRVELENTQAPDGSHYLLCGHMDRVASYGTSGVYVVDRKTSNGALNSDYFRRYNPDNQMSLYTFASQVVFHIPARGVLIDAAQVGVNFTRFQRGFATRTPGQISEWLQDLRHWLALAAQYTTQRYWPHNDKACSLYGGCKYQQICSADPAVREHRLHASFHHKPWNPLEPRGD